MPCEKSILLSFVLPVYNVEPYLAECLTSIIPDITRECEVILVDDGSRDNSSRICDDFSRNNENIKVIHKENGGLSSARNVGISVAKGKYITFIDSDDLVHSGSIEQILEWIQSADADICFLKAEKLYPNGALYDLGECIESERLRGRSRQESLEYLSSRPKYPGSAWSKLFRREFLICNDLHFPYDRRYSEDLGFIRDCILCAEHFDALTFPFYQYRQKRQGSITQQATSKTFNDLCTFVEETVLKLGAMNSETNIAHSFMSFVAYEYLILLYSYTRIPKTDRKEAYIKLKKYSWTLGYSNGLKGRFVNAFCKIFGVRAAAFILKHYRRVMGK